MSSLDVLIAVSSWEDRYRLGVQYTLRKDAPKKFLLFSYRENSEWTEENRLWTTDACLKEGVSLTEHKITFADPAQTWRTIEAAIKSEITIGNSVCVDITTMPRDVIWYIFSFLLDHRALVQYKYHSPEKYNKLWLSRDPGKPRLVMKHSGVATFGRPTLLVITTGFDLERTQQIINFYEPRQTLLFIQSGLQYSNKSLNIEKHYKRFNTNQFKIHETDAYNDDHGLNIIREAIEPYLNNYNIIMTSLGPKTSAVALYRLWQSNSDFALSYAPTNEYNRDYSEGLRTTYEGELGII